MLPGHAEHQLGAKLCAECCMCTASELSPLSWVCSSVGSIFMDETCSTERFSNLAELGRGKAQIQTQVRSVLDKIAKCSRPAGERWQKGCGGFSRLMIPSSPLRFDVNN